jgi:hypothetical protein
VWQIGTESIRSGDRNQVSFIYLFVHGYPDPNPLTVPGRLKLLAGVTKKGTKDGVWARLWDDEECWSSLDFTYLITL